MVGMQWGALGRAIVSRRIECGYETREELAAASGIASRTLGDLETGRKASYRRSTLARLEQALDWPAGTVDEILGEPPPSPRRVAEVSAPATPIASFIERLAAPPSDDELLGTLRHFLGDLPGEYRQQLRDYLQRGTEWAMWAQQNAAAMREVAKVAGWNTEQGMSDAEYEAATGLKRPQSMAATRATGRDRATEG